MTPAELMAAQHAVQSVHAADALLDYLQALIAATRSGAWFVEGLSPRAGIAVLRAARARALIGGRDYVAPDDIQSVLPQTIAHRLVPVAGAGRGRSSRCGRWSRRCRCRERRRSAPQSGGLRPRAACAAGGSRACRAPTRQTLTQGNIYILPTGRLDVRADAGGDAARVDQLPAQPRLRADLPARRQRRWCRCTSRTARCAA